jgi:hypothetical protein
MVNSSSNYPKSALKNHRRSPVVMVQGFTLVDVAEKTARMKLTDNHQFIYFLHNTSTPLRR